MAYLFPPVATVEEMQGLVWNRLLNSNACPFQSEGKILRIIINISSICRNPLENEYCPRLFKEYFYLASLSA